MLFNVGGGGREYDVTEVDEMSLLFGSGYVIIWMLRSRVYYVIERCGIAVSNRRDASFMFTGPWLIFFILQNMALSQY